MIKFISACFIPSRRQALHINERGNHKLSIDEFFKGYEASWPMFDALCSAINSLGPTEMRVTHSQVAFSRRNAFAWAWVPARYPRVRVARLVLTLALRRRHTSSRWKAVVEPVPGRFTHHLELFSVEEMDDEVREWLRERGQRPHRAGKKLGRGIIYETCRKHQSRLIQTKLGRRA